MNVQISDMATNNDACVKNKVADGTVAANGRNTIVDAPVALIKSDTNGGPCVGAGDGLTNIGTVDYRSIARSALSTSSESISELDLYLAIFDSKAAAFTCISSLHQNGPTDTLHFGFLLSINPQKSVRFRVNGWLSNGFKILNLQKRVNSAYVTIAAMA